MYLHELFPTEYYEYLDYENKSNHEAIVISDFQKFYPDIFDIALTKVDEDLVNRDTNKPIDAAGVLNNQKIGIELTQYDSFENGKEFIASWFRFSKKLKKSLLDKRVLNLRGTFFFKNMKNSLSREDHEQYFELHDNQDFIENMSTLIKDQYNFDLKDTQPIQYIEIDDENIHYINCEYYEGDHKYGSNP